MQFMWREGVEGTSFSGLVRESFADQENALEEADAYGVRVASLCGMHFQEVDTEGDDAYTGWKGHSTFPTTSTQKSLSFHSASGKER